mmetsp:Transcript_22211/g.38400  ORF Transcript_22211/g.38400 Transcript_22211/m.38400 type:complete len:218 (-) Transcript_22211:16-669(-)
MELDMEDLEDIVDVQGILDEAQEWLKQNASMAAAAAAASQPARNYSEMGPVDLIYSVADDVLRFTQKQMRADLVSDFFESVTWSDKLIWFFGVLHLALIVTGFKLRNKKPEWQLTFMGVLMILIYFSERLNNLGFRHWEKIASQNYFDRNGLFMFIFWAAPMLFLANLVMIRVFVQIAKLAIRAQRLKTRHAQQQQQQQQATATAQSVTTAEPKKTK